MNYTTFFSIIVPVYNTPVTNLDIMYKSITSQQYRDFELILVDDGSKSLISSYLDDISQRDTRIKVFHTTNQGVSSARNIGIDNSVGKYIIFVDADDYISNKFLYEAKELISIYDVDILYGTMLYIPDRHIKQNNQRIDIYYAKDFLEIKKAIIGSKTRKIDYQILGTPCARVYKADLVKKTKFREGVPLYEDQIFNREILNYATSAAVVPNIWYYYVQNDFSAMHNTMKKSYVNMVKPYWDVAFEINMKEKPELKRDLRINALKQYYTALEKDYFSCDLNYLRKRKEIIQLAKNNIISDAVRNLKISDSNLNLSQKVGLLLMKLHLYDIVYCAQKIKKGIIYEN